MAGKLWLYSYTFTHTHEGTFWKNWSLDLAPGEGTWNRYRGRWFNFLVFVWLVGQRACALCPMCFWGRTTLTLWPLGGLHMHNSKSFWEGSRSRKSKTSYWSRMLGIPIRTRVKGGTALFQYWGCYDVKPPRGRLICRGNDTPSSTICSSLCLAWSIF